MAETSTNGRYNKTTKTDIYKIDPRAIVVKEDFNSRQDYGDLEELAKQIEENGILNPITVIPFNDEDGEDRYRLVDGERRYRATMLLIGRGVNIERVPAMFQSKLSTEKELLVQQLVRNEGKRFNEMEMAIAFKKCLDAGMTKDEIAEKVAGGKRSKVDYCLANLKHDPRIQDAIAKGKITGVLVRQIYSAHKAADKEGATAEILELIGKADMKAEVSGGKETAKVTKKDLQSNDVQLRIDSTKIKNGLKLLTFYIDRYNPEHKRMNLRVSDIADRLSKSNIRDIILSSIRDAEDGERVAVGVKSSRESNNA